MHHWAVYPLSDWLCRHGRCSLSLLHSGTNLSPPRCSTYRCPSWELMCNIVTAYSLLIVTSLTKVLTYLDNLVTCWFYPVWLIAFSMDPFFIFIGDCFSLFCLSGFVNTRPWDINNSWFLIFNSKGAMHRFHEQKQRYLSLGQWCKNIQSQSLHVIPWNIEHELYSLISKPLPLLY